MDEHLTVPENRRAAENLTVITYVGLPLAGKSTAVALAARERPHGSLLRRGIGFSGVTAELSFIWKSHSRESLGYIALKTLPGAVWTPSYWKILIAQADAMIYVVDPQEARHEEQLKFGKFLGAARKAVLFDPRDVPVAVQINKTDLVTKGRCKALVSDLELQEGPVFETCGIKDVGFQETLTYTLNRVKERNAGRSPGLRGNIALRLGDWDPFGPGATDDRERT